MYPSGSTALFLVPVLGLLYVTINVLRYGYKDKRYPPGPPTIPIFGNALQIPGKGFPQKLREWGQQYGGIYSLKIGASTMIVLNDHRAIHDLLNQKSAMYGDRVKDRQWEIAMGIDLNFVFMHATAMWRGFRKTASQMLSPRAIDDKIAPVQEAEITKLVYDLLDTPEDFRNHIKRVTASTASTVIYGHRAKTVDDYWLTIVEEIVKRVNPAIRAGAYLPVEQFPILAWIPDRFLASRKKAQAVFDITDATWIENRRRIIERRRNGDMRHSLADRVYSEDEKTKTNASWSEQQQNHFLGTLFGAATDTTSTAMLNSILFLAKYPKVQDKARVELDKVCGTERMPTWTDFQDCPYVNCIVKEALRIRPGLPTGIPHRVNQDDWFDGYLIPKDATIIIPPYPLHRNLYENPEEYDPDRYIHHPRLAMDYAGSPDYMNRDHYTYGAGKRICPGIHLAERTQWRITARLIWAFNIEPGLDEATGLPIELDTSDDAFEEGLLAHAKPYKVRFLPRSEKHVEIIRKEYRNIESFLEKWN